VTAPKKASPAGGGGGLGGPLFGLGASLVILGLPYLLLTAIYVLLYGPSPPEEVLKREGWLLALLQGPCQLAALGVAVALVRGGGARARRNLGLTGGPLRGFLTGLRMYLPLGGIWWILALLYLQVCRIYGLEVGPQEAQTILVSPASPSWAVPLLVVEIVLLGPLFEETAFRGFLFGTLKERLPWWPAAVASSALFGLLHGAVYAPPLLLLGLMLCWLRDRPGGLWASFGLHAAHNGLVVALILAQKAPL